MQHDGASRSHELRSTSPLIQNVANGQARGTAMGLEPLFSNARAALPRTD